MKAASLFLAFVALVLSSCQVPVASPAKAVSSGLKLSFVIAGQGPGAKGATDARLLLPTASTLKVGLKSLDDAQAAAITQTAAIGAASTLVTVNLGKVALGNYTVAAVALDASGAVQFQQAGTLNVTAATASITLNLVPAFSAGVNASNILLSGQSITGTIPAGGALSWIVPPASLISGGWSLTFAPVPGVTLFAQDSDGATFPASATVGNTTTVKVKNGGTSFITLYNSGSSPQPYAFTFNITIPSPTFTVNSWTPFFDTAVAANSSTTVYADLTDANSVAFSLPASGSGLTFAYQNQDGTPLTGLPTAGNVTVNKSALAVGSNGFFITITNTTGAPISPPGGREYLAYALNPSMVTVAVYGLDSTNRQILVYSLNEGPSSGSLTLLQNLPLPGSYTPTKLVLDPGKTRLYVQGYFSVNGSVDGFNISANGALSEIPGFPVSTPTYLNQQSVLAITTDQNLYWVNTSSLLQYWVPISSSGFLSLAAPTTWGTVSGAAISFIYNLGANIFTVGQMSSPFFAAYQPVASGGATSAGSFTGSAPNSNGAVGVADSYLDTIYYTFNSVFYSYNLQFNPSLTIAPTAPQTAFSLLPNKGPVIDASGVKGYASPYAMVAPYNISAYTIGANGLFTATGASWQIPTNYSAKLLATDITGGYVLLVDSNTTLYSLATTTMTQASLATVGSTIVDLAVVRAQ